MSVNIFGSGPDAKTNITIERGPAGIGFKYLDDEGNFDIQNKRLANISLPEADNDATAKIYVLELVNDAKEILIDRINGVNTSMNIKIRDVQNDISKVVDDTFSIKTELMDKIDENKLYSDNKMSDFESQIEILSDMCQDIVRNTSEIEHLKNYVEIIKTDLESIKSVSVTPEVLQSTVENINSELQRITDRVNNLVTANINNNISTSGISD